MNEVNEASGIERIVMRLRNDSYSLPSDGEWIERNGETMPNNSLSQAADVIERLDQVLTDIANPMGKWMRELKDDERLDGAMAIYMLKDPETYRRMARDALAQ